MSIVHIYQYLLVILLILYIKPSFSLDSSDEDYYPSSHVHRKSDKIRIISLNAQCLTDPEFLNVNSNFKLPWKNAYEMEQHDRNIADFFYRMRPDILKLSEVQSREKVEALLSYLPASFTRHYKIYMIEPKNRGSSQIQLLEAIISKINLEGPLFQSEESFTDLIRGSMVRKKFRRHLIGQFPISHEHKLLFVGVHLARCPHLRLHQSNIVINAVKYYLERFHHRHKHNKMRILLAGDMNEPDYQFEEGILNHPDPNWSRKGRGSIDNFKKQLLLKNVYKGKLSYHTAKLIDHALVSSDFADDVVEVKYLNLKALQKKYNGLFSDHPPVLITIDRMKLLRFHSFGTLDVSCYSITSPKTEEKHSISDSISRNRVKALPTDKSDSLTVPFSHRDSSETSIVDRYDQSMTSGSEDVQTEVAKFTSRKYHARGRIHGKFCANIHSSFYLNARSFAPLRSSLIRNLRTFYYRLAIRTLKRK